MNKYTLVFSYNTKNKLFKLEMESKSTGLKVLKKFLLSPYIESVELIKGVA